MLTKTIAIALIIVLAISIAALTFAVPHLSKSEMIVAKNTSIAGSESKHFSLDLTESVNVQGTP